MIKGTHRDCRKSTGNKLGVICITVCACAVAVLHEQLMYLGMQRNIDITGNNLIPISVPTLPTGNNLIPILNLWKLYTCMHRCRQFRV